MPVFQSCPRLSFVIAPAHLHAFFESEFSDSPLLTRLEQSTPKSRLEALRLECWSVATHTLCSPSRREWVVTVMLVARRLGQEDGGLPKLPTEMWWGILEFVPRWALGSHADGHTLTN